MLHCTCSFSVKLNEKKKVPLKIWFGEEGCKKMFAGGGFGIGNISEKGGTLTRKGWRKIEGGLCCDPERSYAHN